MIGIVNAKINIGLQIVKRREDGYHNLQTVFYPIGTKAGTPENPTEFCDIIEVLNNPKGEFKIELTGKKVGCPLEKNLVFRAAKLLLGDKEGCRVRLDKHLPDGAGLGGGSADAAFTLKLINEEIHKGKYSQEELAEYALKLGADCPFFVYNRPMYAEGVGEKLEDIELNLGGKWLVVVKPGVYVSTKEAFAGITPKPGDYDLRKIGQLPIEKWQGVIKNDFEESIFPQYPLLGEIKTCLIKEGALYASMSGSGSSIFGVFAEYETAKEAKFSFAGFPTIEGTYLLKL